MKAEMTYAELRALDQDIRRIQQSPALSLFLRKYVVAFFQKNATRLEVLYKTTGDLVATYVKHEDSKPVTAKDDKEVLTYVFNDEAAGQKYVTELQAFWNLSFQIEI